MKMKRLSALALMFLMMFGCVSAESMTSKSYYEIGLQYLRRLDKESVEASIAYFESAGNYDQAKRFVMYAQALLDIFSVEKDEKSLGMAVLTLDDLNDSAFVQELEKYLLPSVGELQIYIKARRYETQGKYEEAMSAYEQIKGTLDALERRRSITVAQKDQAYQRALELFIAGNYPAAAEIFKQLGVWNDSEEMYEKCMVLHEHIWMDATCETAKTCSVCGVTEGYALGHDWKAATCTEPKTCARCGLIEGGALGHNWHETICTEPKTCLRCGVSEGMGQNHDWKAASCTEPRTCIRCGLTEEKALGHDWKAATCTEPKTCARCRLTEGSALGHDWHDATYTAPKTCTRCGATEGDKLSFQSGDIISFGHYEQDADIDNGPEAIEWIVLEIDMSNNRALLISKYGLDIKPYNNENVDYATWETCTLRAWLNRDFLNTAFSRAEQQAILTSPVDNSKSQGYSGYATNGGNNTQDKVFLLSYAEAHQYFGVEDVGYYEDFSGRYDFTNVTSRATPTATAISKGAWTSSDYKTVDGDAAGIWWLRSPGNYQHDAAVVYDAGCLSTYSVVYYDIVVRPVLWLNLEPEI